MSKAWADAHPNYHRDRYRKRVFAEIERTKRLKELEEEIWNLQTQTLTS